MTVGQQLESWQGKERLCDSNQPDGCRAVLGCSWKGGEKADFVLKFVFQAFNNLKLHKAVKQLERFMFSAFSNVRYLCRTKVILGMRRMYDDDIELQYSKLKNGSWGYFHV